MSARTTFLAVAAAASLLLTGCSSTPAGPSASAAAETVRFGVSGPKTGPQAEFGQYWEEGFALALADLNAAGGVNGKKIELVWEDSQSDPKQSVPIAQKFVADPTIIAELGDFSSPASMAASNTYQQAGLVQYGFTNSNEKFTLGGDKMWSTSLTQAFYQTQSARAIKKKANKVAVVYLQSDWGKSSFDAFKAEADKIGLEIAYSSPLQPDGDDFRPVLIKSRDVQPDAIVHLGYAPDGAKVVRQVREIGYTGPFYGGQTTPQFLQAAGPAAEGTQINENFLIGNTDPRIVAFNAKFKAKYAHEPSTFAAYAYDAVWVLTQAATRGGATREGVFRGLSSGQPFDSVQFGQFTFDANRRPNDVPIQPVVVKGGAFVKAAGA